MLLILLLLISLVLFVIAYQDFTTRSVTWVLFPCLALLGFLSGMLQQNTLIQLFTNSLVNLCFLALQFLFLFIYYFFKTKKISFLNSKIGLGDILFITGCAVYFSPEKFIVYYSASLLFTLLAFLFTRRILLRLYPERTVPLAGMQAIFLFAVLIITYFGDDNISQGHWLTDYLPV